MRLHTTNSQFLVVIAIAVVAATFLETVSARECHNPPGGLCTSRPTKRSLPRRHLPKRQADDLGCEVCSNGDVCWITGDSAFTCTPLRIRTITKTVTVAQTAARATTSHWATITAWTTVSPTATPAAEPSSPRPANIVKRQQSVVDWENTETVTVTRTAAPPDGGAEGVEVTAVTTVWQTTTAASVPLASQEAAAVESPRKTPVGAIIGGIVAAVVGIGILGAVWLVLRRRRRSRNTDGAYAEKKNMAPPLPTGGHREFGGSGDGGDGGAYVYDVAGGKQPWTPPRSSGSTEAEGLRARPNIRVSIPETAVAVPLPPPSSPRLQIVSPLSTYHHHHDRDSAFDNPFSPRSAHSYNEPLSESRSIVRPGDTATTRTTASSTTTACTSPDSPHSSLTLTHTAAAQAAGPPRLSLDLRLPTLQSEMYGGFGFSLSGTPTSTDPPLSPLPAPEAPAARSIPRKPVPARLAK